MSYTFCIERGGVALCCISDPDCGTWRPPQQHALNRAEFTLMSVAAGVPLSNGRMALFRLVNFGSKVQFLAV